MDGDHPREFALSPNGKFLLIANQMSNAIVVLERDPETGTLGNQHAQGGTDNHQPQVRVLRGEHDGRHLGLVPDFGEVLADGAPEAVLANARVQEFVTGGPNAHKRAAQ